ncbi:AIM24 family protein [Solihabitans fulvus]|uniref:AIM24 family protein n=1 Tax=Solihabitans fulvus TaxID=1892852 RepID=A0A5B2XHQ8_9PSEU|nr:AIM24 family protein [Solihabitans fulvus]KAA2262431.1 AIM24 family protein [Solihabitans fulvus]
MQVRARHTPASGVARLVLAPAEQVQVELGTLVATSFGVGVEAKGNGTALLGLGRESKDGVLVCTAPADGGWVDLAAPMAGDLHVLDLNGSQGWCLAKSSWLALSGTVTMDQQVPPVRALLGGENGFLTYVYGTGVVVLACCGALDVVTLAAGEFVTVDSGHVLGFADSMQCRLRSLSPDAPQSVRTGEGLVFDFAGPGVVLTQTRSPRQLVNWLQANGLSARS